MGNSTSSTVFTSQLNIEREALRAFVALLETEQQALLNGHTEQLLALADSKVQAANELNRLESVRRNELLRRGVEINPASVTAWLQTEVRESLPLWDEIQQLAARAQHLNLTNGELIQAKLRHNQQALVTLHNAARIATGGLYGPDGQPHLPTSGRTLGSG